MPRLTTQSGPASAPQDTPQAESVDALASNACAPARRQSNLLDDDTAGVCIADLSGCIRYANRAMRDMLAANEISDREASDGEVADGKTPDDAPPRRPAAVDIAAISDVAELLRAGSAITPDDARDAIARVASGELPVERVSRWTPPGCRDGVALTLSLLRDDDREPSLLLVEAGRLDSDPIGPEDGARGQLELRPATYDPLTGLPNRGMFMDRLSRVLAKSPRGGSVNAVMFIDLDDFKDVNDGHGHRIGDEVLIETARRLVDIVRPFDTVTRLGGDEFVLICVNLATQSDATGIASRLLNALAAPIVVGDTEVVVTSSIGIAIAPGGGATNAEAVLHEADSAMYRAKARGKNQVEIFDDALRQTANHRMSTEALLRRALRDELFRVHYQPIYELATGDLMSLESLLRLEDPEQGLLSPARFIEVAEHSGLIVPIGAWVLQESCRQLAEWRAKGIVGEDVRVAVNLSARQVSRSDLLKTVSRVLDEAKLDPSALSLELTESIFMDADSAHVRQLEELRAMGVTIEIDDFGTGYSSLGYLKRLPVGVVKVDQSFVAGMMTSSADYGIVSSVVGLGQALDLVTIAEGVETAEQLDALWVLGCDQAQGYFLGRPKPGDHPPLAVTDWGEPAAS